MDSPTASHPLRSVPRTIGRYEVLAPLGQGGMGLVYKARDPRLDRLVALKLVSPGQGADPVASARLLREARAAARLDHPNVCAVYGVEDIEDGHVIAMQLVEGETLRQLLTHGKLEITRFFSLSMQMAAALEEAHGHGVVHRDVKPSNVMVTSGGQVKVLDFGLARLASATPEVTFSAPGTTAGTLGYMAPEQLRGEQAGPRSDIFSLGAVFHEMLAGRAPFVRETPSATLHAMLHEEPGDLRALRSDVPEPLARLVQRMLDKDPALRPSSMAEVSAALRESGGGGLGTEAVETTRGSSPRRLVGARAATAIALLVLAGLIAVVSRSRMGSAPLPPAPGPPPAPAPAALVPPRPQEVAPATVGAAGAPALAVLPFVNLNHDANLASLEGGIADALADALVRSRRFRIVERAQLEEALKELRLSRSEYADPATAQRIGRLVGARYLAIGSFQAWQGQLRLNARLLRVETGELLGAWNRTGALADALRLADELAAEAVGALPPEAAGGR